jgi:CRP-like cAMP-binding protein
MDADGIDAAIFRQWLIAAGRRAVEAQLAHLLCEIWTRLSVVKLVDGYSFQLPLNQTDISDVMGLSLVHVNRTIQALRRRGLIEWSGPSVRILDSHQLQLLAEFDPTHLQLRPAPR